MSSPVPYRAVFEFVPGGIVVCDARGVITGTNLNAKRLLQGLLGREGVRCCDVLGCRTPGTALADACITELALAADAPLPEVRLDLPKPREGSAVWATAATLGSSERYVLVQLRPGVAGDRRRRTEPHWMGAPRLRVFTLGRTRLETAEASLVGDWLGHRPGRLLKYLVTARDRIVPADELAEAFWPEAGSRATASVRQAVHALRGRLEPDRARRTGSAFVLASSGGYELDRGAVWIDADDFETAATEGLRALAHNERDTATAALSRAADLYRGDFLAEEAYADWAFAERDRLRDLASQALRGLAEVMTAAGDLDAATQQLYRLAELEPLDVGIQRDLLAMLVRRGRRPEAARRYGLVQKRYRRTFGSDLPFGLSDLSADG